MATIEFVCPGCRHRVALPVTYAEAIVNDFDSQVGCLNSEEHSDGEPLVMWPDR